MVQVLKSRKTIWYIILLVSILTANYLIYRIPEMAPLSSGIVLGSILDFMLVIPVLTYFFIIRKRFSLKYMGLVILAGYGAAYLIIPSHHFQQFSFVSYLVLFSAGLLVLLELYILYKVLTKLPTFWKEFRVLQNKSSYFRIHLQETISTNLSKNKLTSILLTELSLFYYSLFTWKKSAQSQSGEMYTYHKKTSVIAVYIMLIHATIIETAAFHYFLHQWNGVVALILLVLNIYAVFYFLAEIQAIRLTPFLLTNDTLHLYVGFSKGISIPIKAIEEFREYDGPAKFQKEELKTLFVATVTDLDIEPTKPRFEIILRHPINMHLMYGFKKEVNRVIFNVDQADQFHHSLSEKVVMNQD